MDIFPTLLKAAGGDPSEYELDGTDIMPVLAEGAAAPERAFYWEMNEQTAARRGRWKLVLKGQLVEGAPPEDEVHLSDLDADMSEKNNLKDEHPDIVRELARDAEAWRAEIEERWEREWLPDSEGTTAHK